MKALRSQGMGLGYELVILAIDGEDGRPQFSPELAYSLVAAELVEKATRMEVRGGDVDEQVAAMLEKIPARLEGRGPWRIDRYVGDLVAAGVISLSTTSTGRNESVKRIDGRDPKRFAAAERRLLSVCESRADPEFGDLAFAVLAYVGKCADAHLRGWSNRGRRARLDALVGSIGDLKNPAARVLAACVAEIPGLAAKAPTKPGNGHTLDEQIGLTREGRNAALYWGY